MEGKLTVIEGLNTLLAYELAAMDQYFIHSQMYADWGLTKLYDRISHEFDDEKSHATQLIDRILFLGGTPNMQTRTGFEVGADVPSMLKSDLRVEYEVAAKLKEIICICEKEEDFVSREMLVVLLDDTEMDHAHWLEQQLKLIKLTGLSNYLQSQM